MYLNSNAIYISDECTSRINYIFSTSHWMKNFYHNLCNVTARNLYWIFKSMEANRKRESERENYTIPTLMKFSE